MKPTLRKDLFVNVAYFVMLLSWQMKKIDFY